MSRQDTDSVRIIVMLTMTSLRNVCELLLLLSLSITHGLCAVDSEITDSNWLCFDGTIADRVNTDKSLSCLPWKYRKTPNSTCECGSSIGQVVQCSNKSVCLFSCHCMSYSEDLGTVIMGSCPYLCENVYYIKIHRNMDRVCNQINRTGQLCGKCSMDMPQLLTCTAVSV